MNKFEEKSETMGLLCDTEKGIYTYKDMYSKVSYRTIHTTFLPPPKESHDTDGYQIPYLSVFTKGNGETDQWGYCGIVSQIYKFIGNEVLNQRIRDSVLAIGLPILRETPIISHNLTRMRNEITIQHGVNSPQQGDILPLVIINNSYDGSRSQSIQFGININHNNETLSFAFKLGEMKQVHIDGASTSLSSDVGNYMETFNNDILDMISLSFNQKLTEDQFFLTLNVIEEIGKKRKEEVSKLLSEVTPNVSENQITFPTAWEVFLAITRYSSFEKNLNAKRMLENIAESVLVIPNRMMDVLQKLNS